MRVAAKYADEWNGLGSVKRVQALLERMRGICQEVGRDFGSLTFSTQGAFLLTKDKAEAQKFIDRQVSHMTANPNFKLVEGYSSADEQARDSHFVGGVGELTDLIGRWQEIGVTHVNFNTPRPFTRVPLETFAARVMPAFS